MAGCTTRCAEAAALGGAGFGGAGCAGAAVGDVGNVELDFVLRNLGATTLVGVGVSVNVAIQNLAFDAVNSSYQVVIPRDAVAGFPEEYVEAVYANTLSAVATCPTTAELIEAWRRR